jgi:hypothetical protein
VIGLMNYCINFIIRTLSPEKCVIMWLMSRWQRQDSQFFNLQLNFPRYRSITKLKEKSWDYILEHFVQVAVKNKDILELNINDFLGIICNEMLNVKVWRRVLFSSLNDHFRCRMNTSYGSVFSDGLITVPRSERVFWRI